MSCLQKEVAKMMRIIVVEDANQTRRSISMVLEGAGFIVHQAKNGLEAMDKLLSYDDSNQFDLLLSDIFMPVMTGLELMRLIQQRKIFLPIVAITGYSDKELVDQLDRLNCHHVIDKPFNSDVLLRTVKQVFSIYSEPFEEAENRIAI
jgi:two-component system response regulator FixJ